LFRDTTDPYIYFLFLALGKGEAFNSQWHPFLGDSIFTTDGKEWSDSRHLMRPQFVKNRVSDLHCFERHMQHMLKLIPRDGSSIDIANLFFRFALDSSTDFLLGSSANSLGVPQVEFARAFQQIQAHLNTVSRAGPFRHFIFSPDFKKNLEVLNGFVEPFVEKTLQMLPEELKNSNESDYNFLHALAQFTRDPKVLRDQLVATLLASRVGSIYSSVIKSLFRARPDSRGFCYLSLLRTRLQELLVGRFTNSLLILNVSIDYEAKSLNMLARILCQRTTT
jgi:cytochrome P450